MVDPCPYDRSRFLVVFQVYTLPGEWITAGRLAQRILPMASSEFAKEVSRKLSNLNRFGHLDRRLATDRREHEYARRPERPIVLPVELAPVFHFGRLAGITTERCDPAIDL